MLGHPAGHTRAEGPARKPEHTQLRTRARTRLRPTEALWGRPGQAGQCQGPTPARAPHPPTTPGGHRATVPPPCLRHKRPRVTRTHADPRPCSQDGWASYSREKQSSVSLGSAVCVPDGQDPSSRAGTVRTPRVCVPDGQDPSPCATPCGPRCSARSPPPAVQPEPLAAPIPAHAVTRGDPCPRATSVSQRKKPAVPRAALTACFRKQVSSPELSGCRDHNCRSVGKTLGSPGCSPDRGPRVPSLTQMGKERAPPQAQEHTGHPTLQTQSYRDRHSNSAGDASRHLDSRQRPTPQPHQGAALHPHASPRARPPASPGGCRPEAQSPCPPGWAVLQLRAFLGVYCPPRPAQDLMSSHPSGSSAEHPGPRLTEAAASMSTRE